MKRKALAAVLAVSACLAAGCSQQKETEAPKTPAAVTEAETQMKEAETAAVTQVQTESELKPDTESAVEDLSEAGTEETTETPVEAVKPEVSSEDVTAAADETAVTEAAVAEAVTEAVSEAVQTEPVSEKTETLSEESSEKISEQLEEEASEADMQELAERPDYNALDYVTLGAYTSLPVEVDEITVTDEEVDKGVNDALETAGIYNEVKEGTVENGDIANIDYTGKKDGKEFDGGSAQGTDLTIGSGQFIPGFESGLVGAKIGSTVDLNLTFPEDYGSADLAGQDVVFTVKINFVKRAPEVTVENVKKASDGKYTTVEGYREYIRQQLLDVKQTSQDNQISSELMTQLYNTCKISDYPQDLVEYSKNQMKNYYSQMAQAYGMEMEDFLSQSFGMDEDTFNTQVEEAVKQDLQAELILTAIADKEDIQVSDEDFENGCEKYASAMGYGSVDDFKNDYAEDQIRLSLRMDKAMQFVRDNAVITIKEPETETEVIPEEAVQETEALESASEKQAEEISEAQTE